MNSETLVCFTLLVHYLHAFVRCSRHYTCINPCIFRHDMAIVVVKFSKKGFTARVSENIADGVKFTGNFIFYICNYFS